MSEIQTQARAVLNDVLAAELKRDEAPASSFAHTNAAIMRLLSMCPGWQPWCAEAAELVQDVKDDAEMLRGERGEK